MKALLWAGGKQAGPYAIEDIHEMSQMGSLAEDTLVRPMDRGDWLALPTFLAAYPVQALPETGRARSKEPSKWRGFGAALGVAIAGGVVIAIITALTGAMFTVLWWGIGWGAGLAAKSGARQASQGVGVLAFLATIPGIFISGAGAGVHETVVVIFGGLGLLVSLVGSLWLAFRTGSSDWP